MSGPFLTRQRGRWHAQRDGGGKAEGYLYLNPVLLAFSMLLTLVIVNLMGIVQGENARILSFYAPFLLLAAGTTDSRGDASRRPYTIGLISDSYYGRSTVNSPGSDQLGLAGS